MLRDSENLYRAFFERTTWAVFIHDEDGRFIAVSPQACEILGYSEAELIRLSVADIDPDAEERRYKETFWTRGGAGSEVNVEVRLRRKDGTIFPAEISLGGVEVLGRPCILAIARDISERVALESALRTSEERSRALFENANAAINIKDRDGRFVLTNSKYKALFAEGGRVEEEGKTIFDLHDREFAESVIAADRMAVETGAPVHFEGEIPLADGSRSLFLINKFPIPAPTGDDVWVGSIVLDVKELRAAQERLAEREAQLRALFDAAPDAIFMKDLDGRYSRVNQATCQMIGLPAEAIVGKTDRELFPPDEVEMIEEIDRAVLRGKAIRKDYAVIRKGERKTIEVAKSPIRNLSGEVIGLCGVSRDVTEHRKLDLLVEESQARLQAILDHSPWAINLMDTEGRLLICNTAYAQRFGMDPDDLIGKRQREIHHPSTARESERHVEEVVKTGRPQIFEVARKFPVLGDRRVMVVCFPVTDHKSKVIGVGSIGVDVTEQRLMEDMLREAHKMQSVGYLTGGIAHEFNNLLQGMRSFLEILREQCARETETARILDRLMAMEERGARLTRQLLAFAGKQVLSPERIDVKAVLDDLIATIRHAGDSGIEIVARPAPDLPRISVDLPNFQDVLFNLVRNAQRAMPTGGRLTIEAESRRLERETPIKDGTLPAGDYVEIRVTDTGCGMTADVLARACDPFFTTRRVGEAQGLGLSMAYGFCRQSGGNLELTSAPGEGTTARILLPAIKPEAAGPGRA